MYIFINKYRMLKCKVQESSGKEISNQMYLHSMESVREIKWFGVGLVHLHLQKATLRKP